MPVCPSFIMYLYLQYQDFGDNLSAHVIKIYSFYNKWIRFTHISRICKQCVHAHVLQMYKYMYGTAKKKRPGYLVGNLVATNWPIEKALHAIGYNQIPTK